MLQAALINVGVTVLHRMIFRRAVDVREIKSIKSCSHEDGHVSVVWEQPVNFIGERIGNRMRSRLCKLLDQPTVLIACLKHVGRAGGTARVKVQSYSHV